MMEQIRNNKRAAIHIFCAVLMAILLILQFTPFWHYGEAGESCSIGSYVWFPSDCKALETWLCDQIENHDLNRFVGMPILMMALIAVGAVLCLIKPEQGITAVLPTLCGAAGIICYLTVPALKLGSSWAWHLLICIALLALGVIGLVQWYKDLRAE